MCEQNCEGKKTIPLILNPQLSTLDIPVVVYNIILRVLDIGEWRVLTLGTRGYVESAAQVSSSLNRLSWGWELRCWGIVLCLRFRV